MIAGFKLPEREGFGLEAEDLRFQISDLRRKPSDR
jgi:hypothetical protein